MTTARKQQDRWYHERTWAAFIVLGSLVAAYIFTSLAIDSGNIMEYLVAISLIILAVNRLAHIVLMTLKKASKD